MYFYSVEKERRVQPNKTLHPVNCVTANRRSDHSDSGPSVLIVREEENESEITDVSLTGALTQTPGLELARERILRYTQPVSPPLYPFTSGVT